MMYNESYCRPGMDKGIYGSTVGDSWCTQCGDVFSVFNRERYSWQPSHCSLPEWNAKDFCTLLGNRTIFSLGDSTFRQVSQTLASMIAAGGGNCVHLIYHHPSADLMNERNLLSVLLHRFLPETNLVPDIVLTGFGAHIHSIVEYENNWKSLQQQFHTLHQRFPRMKFIWKKQSPGHIDCKNFSGPLETMPVVPVEGEKDQYQWNLHDTFDQISVENIRNITISYDYSELPHKGDLHDEHRSRQMTPFLQVMDMTPLKLRPDSHNDCLHYCMPGALNLFPVLLYNMLLTGQC
jgi:hypothetical protein